jgi:general secretion pathway protein A
MYESYYHLREQPFSITPDPRFLFFTEQHREALNHLLFGVYQRKGFICLTGEVGAGKTTLCRALLDELDESRVESALILNPMLNETQLLRAIAEEFGLHTPAHADRLAVMKQLNEHLLAINAAGREAVVIIDEAQDLPPASLEMCRLLSNLETRSCKLLQIVLVGQPELRELLGRREFRQLAQRITVRYHLRQMTRDETAAYLRHRVSVAGGNHVLKFDRKAVREIYRYSRGTPRLVNAVGDKALLAGYVRRTGTIDRSLVRLAVRELKEAG